jgi:hypothetical protein
MARLMFAVFAERGVVDRFSNHLDLHGVVEQLDIPEPPAELMKKALKAKKYLAARGRLALLLHWRRTNPSKPERANYTARVQLIGPGGEKLVTAEQEFALREHVYMRSLLGFDALPVAGPGTYTAVVSLKVGGGWKRMGETSFQLVYRKHVPAEAKVRLQ